MLIGSCVKGSKVYLMSQQNKQPFEMLADIVYQKIHEKNGLDAAGQKYATEIIDNAINYVLNRLAEKCKDEKELEKAIKEISTPLVAFIALFIEQLEFFAKGQN